MVNESQLVQRKIRKENQNMQKLENEKYISLYNKISAKKNYHVNSDYKKIIK